MPMMLHVVVFIWLCVACQVILSTNGEIYNYTEVLSSQNFDYDVGILINRVLVGCTDCCLRT